ncbi:hypothetical protein NUW58_g178 [Xylaria curta]|uniref:Uncharacterized protein n=1 Tax=Xylaria curta TaxID=42375 RepID=A0ACC1PQ71_9PEZI|nr:hypothetical protein NUW58_g178 [Xylaria curta]
MASTRTTKFIGDHSCDQKKKSTDTPRLPSPELTDRSDNDSASEDNTDREVIEKAFQVIKDTFCGLRTEAYPVFHFENPSSFQSLQARLEKDSVNLSRFFKNCVRFDWNANTCDLLLRLMTTVIHDSFGLLVMRKIDAELLCIAEDPALLPFYDEIFPAGTASIKGPDFSKSPDAQLAYIGARHPPFVLEVAYTQEEKAVLKKVVDYYMKIPGCTVLSFDLDYAKPSIRIKENHAHNGAVSLVTSKTEDRDRGRFTIIENLIEEKVFREAGKAIEGAFEIPFRLFIPLEHRQDLPESANDASVRIDFAFLAKLLSKLEPQQRLCDAPPEPSVEITGIIERKRNGEEILINPDPKRLKTLEPLPSRSQRLQSVSTHPTTD